MLMPDQETPPKLHPLQDTHPYLASDEIFAVSASKMIKAAKGNKIPHKRKPVVKDRPSQNR
jgi:hypothetical protein